MGILTEGVANLSSVAAEIASIITEFTARKGLFQYLALGSRESVNCLPNCSVKALLWQAFEIRALYLAPFKGVSFRWRRAHARLCVQIAPLSRCVETWLILPVVICLSQRLSHACLSISIQMVKLRIAH